MRRLLVLIPFLFFAGPVEAAFPTIEQITSSSETSNVTTHNVTLSAMIDADDLIVVIGVMDSTSTPSTLTKDDATVGTFTELFNQHVLPTPSQAVGVAWVRKADGTEDGATIQPTSNEAQKSEWYSFIIPAGEWNEDIATGVTSATETGSNQTTPDPPNLAPGWGALDILWIALVYSDNTNSAPTVTVYSESSNQNSRVGGTGSGLIGMSSRENAVASYNPPQYTISASDQSYGATIAVRPAAASSDNVNLLTGKFGKKMKGKMQ